MRKNVFGRRLKRDANERKALFKGLMSSLVIHGKIKTTESKAKAIKGQIEKLVTKAKKENLVINALQEFLTPQSITKLVQQVAPTFQNRPGGYTRIVRLGKRFSDNASLVILEWVEAIKEVSQVSKVPKVSKGESKRTKPLSEKTVTRSKVARKPRVSKKEKK